MHIHIKHIRCAGCNVLRSFDGVGLRVKYDPNANWKLLLACSSNCAQKFIRTREQPELDKLDILITKNGPIPYRKIIQTLDR